MINLTEKDYDFIKSQLLIGISYRSLALNYKIDASSFRKFLCKIGFDKFYEESQRAKYEKKQQISFQKRLAWFSNSDLPKTREYLINNLKIDIKFKSIGKGVLLKEDFIEQYYLSRKNNNLPIFNYDFSKLPDLIPNKKYDVPIYVNEISTKTGKVIGDWKTNYHDLITCLEDNRSCAGMVGKTKTSQFIDTEKFIEKSIKIHGEGKFNYDQVEYVNNHTPIKLMCNTCGNTFYQKPPEHLYGTGYCPECAMKISGISKRYTTEEFVDKLKLIFGDKYNYSETRYIDSKTPVVVIDNNGNSYKRLPSYLLAGNEPCSSKGELLINLWCIKNLKEGEFQQEVLFKDIIPERKFGVYIDFIIRHNDKIYSIEYNGIQHYKFQSGFHHDLQSFKNQVKRDTAVREYFSKNNTIHIEIPYTYDNYDEINNILSSIILEDKEIIIKIPEISYE